MKFLITTLCGVFAVLSATAQWNYDSQNVIYSTNGNVGIGNTSPTDKLHVSGDIRLSGLSRKLIVGSEGSINDYLLLQDVGSGTAALQWVQDGSAKFGIDGVTGNVGIGLSNPSFKLDISGAIGISGVGVVNTNNNANDMYINCRVIRNESTVYQDGMYINYNANGGSAAHLRFYANGTGERMRIDANTGNVGIGTSAPQWKLDVAGQIAANGQAIANVMANEITLGDVAGGDGYRDKLYFCTRDQKRVAIDENGNMGIGTLSPTKKLTVNGTIYGKEVQVDLLVPGPDYVFEKDYNLPSLEEVKSYIEKNKHLPEVPSAKEMEANGINVGEMNMILLKKVEELTLYLIEVKKEIQELRVENKQLKELTQK